MFLFAGLALIPATVPRPGTLTLLAWIIVHRSESKGIAPPLCALDHSRTVLPAIAPHPMIPLSFAQAATNPLPSTAEPAIDSQGL